MNSIAAGHQIGEFGPEHTDAMGSAFDVACDLLKNANQYLADCEYTRAQLARRILELSERGERDPQKLAAYAIAMMKL